MSRSVRQTKRHKQYQLHMKVVNTQLLTMVEPMEAQTNANGLVCAISSFSPGENRILLFAFSLYEDFH